MGEEQKVRELLDRGLTYYGLGQVQQALETWQQALELDPQNPRAREYVEFVRMSWGPQGYQRAEEPKSTPAAPASVFSAPPPARVEEPPPPVEPPKTPPAFVPPSPSPVPATGWGELFAAGTFPEGPSVGGSSWPSGTTLTASTLPPHPQETLPPPTVAPAPPGKSWEAAEKTTPPEEAVPTVPYQAVPTRLREAVPTLEAVPASSDVLDLVSGAPAPEPQPEPSTSDLNTWLKGAADLLQLDDFSGAIELLDKILDTWPDNQEAFRMREEAARELVAMYRSKIGALSQIPRVRMAADEIIWLNLDHRAGFLLSLIDGRTSYDEIISVCGLTEIEALRLFAQLLQEGVIEPI